MVRQYASPWSAVHVYLQKPPTHFFGVAAVLPHCVSSVQFGCGRVSRTHAPWSQNLPAPHIASSVHAFTHEPRTHCGVSPLHWLSVVHTSAPLGALGSQAPFEHVKPVAQGAVSQLTRHWPAAQIFPLSHSLENLHVFAGAVHEPATHV